MLVLTRKINEKVVIANNIVVTVIDVRNGSVRLGFEAPKEVEIWRSEIKDKQDANNRESNATLP